MKKNNENLIRYTINIPEELHTDFKTVVTSERKNMKEVILESMQQYLDDYFKKSNRKR